MNILRYRLLNSNRVLAKHFISHQVAWVQAEEAIHQQHKQARSLAEKKIPRG